MGAPRGQLMRALYLAGRQADALELYRRPRAISFPRSSASSPVASSSGSSARSSTTIPNLACPQRRRRRSLLAAAGFCSWPVAYSLPLQRQRSCSCSGPAAGAAVRRSPTAGQGEVVALDATTGSLRGRISAGRTPSTIAVAGGIVWVVDADARTVLRLSESLHVLDAFSTGATPTDIAVGAGSVWVANGRPLARAQFTGPVATAIARLDPTTGNGRSNIQLPERGGSVSNLVENHVAVEHGSVWAVAPDFGVVRIDAATGKITARSYAVRAAAVAAGPAGVWVLSVDGAVVKLDTRTARPVARANVPASSIGSIAVGQDAVWVTSPVDGTLWGQRRCAGPRSAQSMSPGASPISPLGPDSSGLPTRSPERS